MIFQIVDIGPSRCRTMCNALELQVSSLTASPLKGGAAYDVAGRRVLVGLVASDVGLRRITMLILPGIAISVSRSRLSPGRGGAGALVRKQRPLDDH